MADGVVFKPPGSDGSLTLEGDLEIRDPRGRIRLRLDAEGGQLFVFNAEKEIIARIDEESRLWLGGHGTDGDVMLLPRSANHQSSELATIRLVGDPAQAWVGGKGNDGNLVIVSADREQRLLVGIDSSTKAGQIRIKDGDGNQCIWLDGRRGKLRLGSEEREGDLTLSNAQDETVLQLVGGASESSSARIYGNGDTAELRIGGEGVDGDIHVTDRRGRTRIHLDGSEGDIILKNADCAEDFDLAGARIIEPGTVVVLRKDGKLHTSQKPYDRRVVGVIAGAGQFKPGLVLDRRQGLGRGPVSLLGKTYCKVEANSSPVCIGDLLTTSSVPGHAMKAQDVSQTAGSILGKALGSLTKGQGLIPVLVTLQ